MIVWLRKFVVWHKVKLVKKKKIKYIKTYKYMEGSIDKDSNGRKISRIFGYPVRRKGREIEREKKG